MDDILNVYNGYKLDIFIAHYREIIEDAYMLTEIYLNSRGNIVEAQKKVYSLAMTNLDDEEKKNINKAMEIMEFARKENRMLEALRNIHTTYDKKQRTIEMMSSKANEIIKFLEDRSNRLNRLNQRAAASVASAWAPATRDAARAVAAAARVSNVAGMEGAAAGRAPAARAPAAAASRHTFARAIGRAPSPASRESWASRAAARAAEADDAIVRQEIALMEDADLEKSIADAEAAAAEEAAEEAAVAAAVAEVDAYIKDEDEELAWLLHEELNSQRRGGKSRKQKSRKQKSRKQKSRKQKSRKQKSRKQKSRKQKYRKQKSRKQKYRK